MPIVTQPIDAQVHIDPYSFNAEIQVLSGNPVQNYNKDTNEYEPDRSLIPCLLMPYVSVQDPEGVMNGSQTITGAEWYEGAPKADGSNRITPATAGYVISDTGAPQHSLKIKKNVDYDNPIEIYSVFFFIDKRKNLQERVERSTVLRTSIFDSKNYSLKMDKPKNWVVNPLDMIVDSSGLCLYSITSQLYSGDKKVPDENTAYWYDMLENGVWREFTEEEVAVFVDGKNADGTWGKTLTLDVQMFRNIAIRCRAAYYTGTRPAVPNAAELVTTTSIKVEMPPSLRVKTKQYKGVKLTSRMNTTVGFEAVLSYNKGIIGQSKNHLFRIEWYCKSTKPGSTPVLAGTGRTVEFKPSAYGFDPLYNVSIYAKVYVYVCCQMVMSGDSAVFSGEKLITSYQYE